MGGKGGKVIESILEPIILTLAVVAVVTGIFWIFEKT